ncbi:CDP-glucose 4,6-dehydratase [Lacisediminimonas sp.]|uniref:CDP-glucose 4,6-dehydratase n=1 Tax=Lacisediminimonas sp. TaxID=3060582 RepID=UPI00271DE44D|nr:CDP-glucose 4,6-dehydratase [Lacisediminimonas sp.]MDO8298706.1 CDP-glucose 4,6-dehydratase [Lacisediminimonas sp.]
MTPGFWRGKRVFMTGHTGFKGSWMSLWLQSLGAELTGYALKPPTTPSLFEQARVAEGMRSIDGDIRELDALTRAMQAARPEIVIHMAAQSLVRYSYANPVETYATNVMGTLHLLEAVRATPGVKAVVIVTTDKCYENREWVWGYRENDPMGGYDPYSNSKACAELVSAAYRSSFFNARDYARHGVAVASVRAGNVIGGGDWAQDRLIPDILTAFEQGKSVLIRHPDAVRPWQHVLEPLRGYLQLAEKLVQQGPVYAEGWNFGPNGEDARPVRWIVEQMASRWGADARWHLEQGELPHEAGYLKLDISKARQMLGWHPRLKLNDSLNMIVDWARQRGAGSDVRSLTEQQIATYQTMTQTS